MERQRFVAREIELAQLDSFLNRAMDGQGQVCFVAGEAGSGKTALMAEFAHRALEQHQDLVVAVGQCDAQTGRGDPYLPFREILAQLTGDVEAKLAQRIITKENASRLRKLMHLSGEALAKVGPDLIGIFVPFAGLAARAAAFLAEKVGWLERLEKYAGLPRKDSEIQQEHIFEQYTSVLRTLAEKQPLLLLLDDLQWTDDASIGLLFRLGRRIGPSRILIVGAYRPAEVALGRPATDRSGEPAEPLEQIERHPLEKILAEFKRYFGNIQVDLDQAQQAEGRQFVDDFLDTEPNRLGEGFRQALYEHTGGHPLFALELLRDMQERGDLVHDEQGYWIEGPVLDWEALPARVEGVIEERIDRLQQALRDSLTVGSVEGETFTAEVVARVQESDAHRLIRRLSGELAKQHRLVQFQGTRRLGPQRLSLYRFQHNLFQTYLYQELDKVERSLLHEDVGTVLEALYADQADEIAVQLAFHFVEAGLTEKAAAYLHRAGEQAAARFANTEAANHFSRALELMPEDDLAEHYALRLAREQVYALQGERNAQKADLDTLERLAETLDDNEKRAEVALRQAVYAEQTCDYPAASEMARTAIVVAQRARDTAREARGYLTWGVSLARQGDFRSAQTRHERALALAVEAGLRQVEADSLRNLGATCWYLTDYPQAQDYYERALQIYREIGNRSGEAKTLNNLAFVLQALGETGRDESIFEQALHIFRELGDLQSQAWLYGNLGNVSKDGDDYVQARSYFQQALEISRDLDDLLCEGLTLNNLGLVSKQLGYYAEALEYFEEPLRIFGETGDRHSESIALLNLGDLYLICGNYHAAQAHLEQALHLTREIGDRRGESSSLNKLCRLHRHLGENDTGRDCSREALRIAEETGDLPMQGTASTNNGHILARLESWEKAVDSYRQALEIHRKLGENDQAMEALAGLARVHLAQGDPSQALVQVEEILKHLETDTLEGTEEPFQVYLTCYRVLKTNQDLRAQGMLTVAHNLLQEQAANIGEEELRRGFLENVAAHREIVRAFAGPARHDSAGTQ
jgi:predicted ATPase